MKAQKRKSKNNHGCFVVNSSAIVNLLHNRATAEQICAYLTLSCYTKKTSKSSSTASYNAIKNKLKIGLPRAKEIVSSLLQMEYKGRKLLKYDDGVYLRTWTETSEGCDSVLDYNSGTVLELDYYKYKKSIARWDLSTHFHKEVWLQKNLVDPRSSSIGPSKLKLLQRICGDLATRVYLMLLYNYDLDRNASKYFWHEFRMEDISEVEDVVVWKASEPRMTSLTAKMIELLTGSVAQEGSKEYTYTCSCISDGLNILEQNGLIHRAVVVSLFDTDAKKIVNRYELDCKIVNKLRYDSHLFCRELRDLAISLGYKPSRADGRFYDEYIAIAPGNLGIRVEMVYRLNHGVKNPNNLRVEKRQQEREQFNSEVYEWIYRAMSRAKPTI